MYARCARGWAKCALFNPVWSTQVRSRWTPVAPHLVFGWSRCATRSSLQWSRIGESLIVVNYNQTRFTIRSSVHTVRSRAGPQLEHGGSGCHVWNVFLNLSMTIIENVSIYLMDSYTRSGADVLYCTVQSNQCDMVWVATGAFVPIQY